MGLLSLKGVKDINRRLQMMKRYVIHMFFPNRCPFCGQVMEFGEHCCTECKPTLTLLDNTVCSVCSQKECRCFQSGMGIDGSFSAFNYEGSPKDAILAMKFKNRPEYAEHLAYFLAKQIGSYKFDCITFVPMHDKKKKKRGYNQAELLAKHLAQELNIPCKTLLVKIKESEEQHTLSLEKRKYNVVGSYAVMNTTEISGKCILLVDDILTTGATVKECSKMLKTYRAKKVYSATICRVSRNRSE